MAAPDTPGVPGPGTPSDEELVRQAQGGSRDATAALWERCHAALDRLVGWWSRERGLRAEELEEVRQEAECGFLEAVAAYAEDRREGPGRACFRTFLNRVVRNHLEEWERRRRAESHHKRSVDWAAELDRRALQTPWERCGLPEPRAGDPVSSVLWKEFLARLIVAVGRLDATQRWLWEQWADGRSLHKLAAERGLSYDQARRLLHRVLALLQEAVR